MGRRGFQPMLDLATFTPADWDQAEALELALVEAGTGEGMAAAIARKLLRHGELGLTPSSRTVYRRELMRLDGPPWGSRSATVSTSLRSDSSVAGRADIVHLARSEPTRVALAPGLADAA